MTSNHYVKYVIPEAFNSNFTLDLMLKDIRIATQIAQLLGVPALAATRAQEIYAIAANQGVGPGDNTRIVPFIERLMGVDSEMALRPPENQGIDSIRALIGTHLIGALGGAIIASRAGVDPAMLIEVVNASSGRSQVTATDFSRHYLSRRFDANISVGQVYRECSMALDFASKLGAPMMLCGLTRDIYALAMSRGMAGEDNTHIMRVLEQLMNYRLAGSADPRT